LGRRGPCVSPSPPARTRRCPRHWNVSSPRLPQAHRILISKLHVTNSRLAIASELAESPVRLPIRRDSVVDYRIRRAREYILDHTGPCPKLEELESVTRLGKAHICELFNRSYGMSMNTIWQLSRLDRAKTLLCRGEQISDFSHRLGFCDEAHFSKTFRRHNGLSPRDWVRLVKCGAQAR
jgi:AraC-like DNA-binding protein